MANEDDAIAGLAAQVRIALNAADLSAFEDLLDPDVRWGAPDDPSPSCKNREQVLAWYRRGRESGVRARVTEVVVGADRIVVGLAVTGTLTAQETGREADRWQVLTVHAGRITDIVGFDERTEAFARAEIQAS